VKYEKAKEELRNKALNLGYWGQNLYPRDPGEPLGAKAEIELILQTGSQYLFGEVIWEEPSSIQFPSCKDFWISKPGALLLFQGLPDQLNLINSDRFASVNIRADKAEAGEGRVPVRVQLEPRSKRLRPGSDIPPITGQSRAPLSGPECLSAGPRIQCRPEHCPT